MVSVAGVRGAAGPVGMTGVKSSPEKYKMSIKYTVPRYLLALGVLRRSSELSVKRRRGGVKKTINGRTHKSGSNSHPKPQVTTMLSASAQPFEPMPLDFGLCFANGHAQAIFCSESGHPEHEVLSHISDEAIDEFIPDAFDVSVRRTLHGRAGGGLMCPEFLRTGASSWGRLTRRFLTLLFILLIALRNSTP